MRSPPSEPEPLPSMSYAMRDVRNPHTARLATLLPPTGAAAANAGPTNTIARVPLAHTGVRFFGMDWTRDARPSECEPGGTPRVVRYLWNLS